jgi:hypothetical protein
MAERLIDRLEAYLNTAVGRQVELRDIRAFLQIEPGGKDDQNLRVQMATTMVARKLVVPSGRKDGVYKVIRRVNPVKVYGRERKSPITIRFPRTQDTGEELLFAQDIIFREGDLILLSGQSNKGKTALCINFCGENIESHPVLMGNEYTSIDNEPMPRFLSRLDHMEWVEWADELGEDKFTLLPVREDYAEHIVKDRINIIDWINLDANMLYGISAVMEGIKRELGRGIAIIAIQKKEGESAGRGGQFTKDFADCELLLDQFDGDEILLTVGKVKEYKRPVSGRMFAYKIADGVKIMNFREVVKCPVCRGLGNSHGKVCGECNGLGKVDKGIF